MTNLNKTMLRMRTVLLNSYLILSITIKGSELNPGMYLYTLIVDGKEVDTKRMILTE